MTASTRVRSSRRIGAALAVVALVAAALVAAAATPASAAPTHLSFNPPPSGGTAGVAWATQPKVEIRDTSGVVTTGTGSNAQVYLRITSPNTPGGTLTCTSNPVSAVAGVATFAGCTIDKKGTYTLTAEAPAIGLAVKSGSFNITAGTATKLGFKVQPGDGTEDADLTTQPAVEIQDAFGNPVGSGNNSITLAIGNNPGGGDLTCDGNTVDAAGGEATFAGCAIDNAGTGYTLTATATGLTSATSAPFNVAATAATALAFVIQPGSGEPGESLPDFSVAFVDGSGRIVTTDDRTIEEVELAPGSPTGTVSGCLGLDTNVNGVVTINSCEINTTGTGFRFLVTAGGGGTPPTATSAAFTVGILHLAFIQQPGNGTVGNPLSVQPMVAVQDVSNTIVASSDEIQLSIAPGTGTSGATLTCAANPISASNGIAAFALCKIDTPGIGYQITATDNAAGLSVNSAAFNVVGPPAKLVFSTQPVGSAAGTPFSTQPVVQIEDTAGNVVTTDNTTVVSLAITEDTPAQGGPGTLTCQPRTAAAGVATFQDCSINQAGLDYQLTATSTPALAEATSDEFNIGGLQRIFGQTAIDTSIEISREAFPADESADAVVLARSDFFSDALAGGPLAADRNGPLLITPGASQSSSLDPRVRNEIERVLEPGGTVYILGGPLALSSGIDAQITSLGFVPERVAGGNLFSTAVAIADELGNPPTIFEATGLNFPDALSAVPAAIEVGGAILLTNGNQQSPETAAYLVAHPPTTRYAIGGPLAAYGADPGAIPVYGQDLFGTSAAVAQRFFAIPADIGVATGADYPDALSGGVFMATGGRLGPVLLVNRDVPLPPLIAGYLIGIPPVPGYIFGGPLAVSAAVEDAIIQLL